MSDSPRAILEGVFDSLSASTGWEEGDFDARTTLHDLFTGDQGAEEFWFAYHLCRDFYNRIIGASAVIEAPLAPAGHVFTDGPINIVAIDMDAEGFLRDRFTDKKPN